VGSLITEQGLPVPVYGEAGPARQPPDPPQSQSREMWSAASSLSCSPPPGLHKKSTYSSAFAFSTDRSLNIQLPTPSVVLRNRNYFLQFRFRFRLLTSYGSGSELRQDTVPVPPRQKVTVPTVPVPQH
jgi:hypothetical protein